MSKQRNWAGGRDVARTRAKLIDLYGYECHICHQLINPALRAPDPGSYSIDHVLPRALGGSNALENLRPAHLGCNSRKGKRLNQPRRRGYIDATFFDRPPRPDPPRPEKFPPENQEKEGKPRDNNENKQDHEKN